MTVKEKNSMEHQLSPSKGRSMVGLLKKEGEIINRAHDLIINDLKKNTNSHKEEKQLENWIENNILFNTKKEKILNKNLNRKIVFVSTTLILYWITGKYLNLIRPNESLSMAEILFEEKGGVRIGSLINDETEIKTINLLNEIEIKNISYFLLYFSEIFETKLEALTTNRNKKNNKRKSGVYYTPMDVVNFIIKRCTKENEVDKKYNYLDPAAGSGTFLVGLLTMYKSTHKRESNKNYISFVVNSLYGIDTSETALQSAAIILGLNCFEEKQKTNIKNSFKEIGTNLKLIDATIIKDKNDVHDIFPNLSKKGFDVIVSNPPYSFEREKSLNLFESDEEGKKENYIPFIYLIFNLLNNNCNNEKAGLVLPLSIVTNSKNKFKKIRDQIYKTNGTFELYNFDRTPDSLFGDHVKTRNTILFFKPSTNDNFKNHVFSSYLNRWSSENRRDLFNSLKSEKLPEKLKNTNKIPKIGDKEGVKLLDAFNNERNGCLDEIIQKKSVKEYYEKGVATKTTAYNSIPVKLVSFDDQENDANIWIIKDSNFSPEMVYAIMKSRITYWLWRVWEDGFHFNTTFIKSLPFGYRFFQKINLFELDEIGANLWKHEKEEGHIGTYFNGNGRRNYESKEMESHIDCLDYRILSAMNLEYGYVCFLKTHIERVINAGRLRRV